MTARITHPDGSSEDMEAVEEVVDGVRVIRYRSAADASPKAAAPEAEPEPEPDTRPASLSVGPTSRKSGLDAELERRWSEIYAAAMEEIRRGVRT